MSVSVQVRDLAEGSVNLALSDQPEECVICKETGRVYKHDLAHNSCCEDCKTRFVAQSCLNCPVCRAPIASIDGERVVPVRRSNINASVRFGDDGRSRARICLALELVASVVTLSIGIVKHSDFLIGIGGGSLIGVLILVCCQTLPREARRNPEQAPLLN